MHDDPRHLAILTSATSRGASHAAATVLVVCCLAVLSSTRPAASQDLEPRAYVASPVGLNFLALVAGRSTGGVVVDPSLPIDDVQASVYSLGVGVGTTFDFLGRTALVVAALPYAWVDASGNVGEERRQVSRAGMADPRIRLSVNLIGGRALTLREFAKVQRRTIVGVSVTALPPLGQYDPTRLVNIGSHRWAFKPEVGVSRLFREKWTMDVYAGAWLFTDNDEFYTGAQLRSQKPIVALQLHGSYTVKPRLWVAVDGTWYSGGTTSINGIEKADLQRSTRIGATLSLPIARQQSFKVSWSAGATTRIGADFRTLGAAWQYSWFSAG
jgi:hypothetical protein